MPAAIEGMQQRLDATQALLVAQLPARIITRELKHYTERTEAELLQGVVMLISAGERDYKNQKGMVAKEGTQRMLIIGNLRVVDSASAQYIETAELELIAEIKAALNVGVVGLSFALQSVEHSRQLDFPYGWVVADVDAGPPRASHF